MIKEKWEEFSNKLKQKCDMLQDGKVKYAAIKDQEEQFLNQKKIDNLSIWLSIL